MSTWEWPDGRDLHAYAQGAPCGCSGEDASTPLCSGCCPKGTGRQSRRRTAGRQPNVIPMPGKRCNPTGRDRISVCHPYIAGSTWAALYMFGPWGITLLDTVALLH